MLNVEGDAFGAGLLQFFVDRTAKKEEGSELREVKPDPSLPAPESSPLIEKRGLRDWREVGDAKVELSDSVM